jgi:hypothetical protein
MNVFQFYVGEIDPYSVGLTVPRGERTLLGAPPPPRGHPLIAMMSYYLNAGSFTYSLFGNTEGIALCPVPLGGRTGTRGGRHNHNV